MNFKMVKVVWKDSGYLEGWNSLVQISNWAKNTSEFVVTTTGYLIEDSETWIVVAPAVLQSSNAVFGALRIHQSNIIQMEVVDG